MISGEIISLPGLPSVDEILAAVGLPTRLDEVLEEAHAIAAVAAEEGGDLNLVLFLVVSAAVPTTSLDALVRYGIIDPGQYAGRARELGFWRQDWTVDLSWLCNWGNCDVPVLAILLDACVFEGTLAREDREGEVYYGLPQGKP